MKRSGWKQIIQERLAPLRLPPEREREIIEELAQDLEATFEEALRRGDSSAAARAQALKQIADDSLLARELARSEQTVSHRLTLKADIMNDRILEAGSQNKFAAILAALWQDARFALRLLRKQPGFAFIVIVTLALSISANTVIFSVLNTALLKPLPVKEPERLVGLYRKVPQDENFNRFSYPNFTDTRDRSQSFDGLAAYFFTPFNLSASGQTERVFGKIVTGNYFSVLGVEPAQGRAFLPEEDRTSNTHPVAVIGYGLWQRRFGGDPTMIGKTILLNGYSFTVIGIAPKNFQGAEVGMAPDVFVPMMMQERAMPGRDWLTDRGIGWLRVLGRLKAAVSVAQAQAELHAVAEGIRNEHPKINETFGIAVVEDFGIHPQFRKEARNFLLVLMAVVGLVLLIACANVAGLLLARAAERQQEIGVRLALGAGRSRLIGQLLIESLLLALLGGAAGLLLAPAMLRGLSAMQQVADLPSAVEFTLDQRVLAFTLLATLLTGIVFGLAPAFSASRVELMNVIKSGTAGKGAGRTRLRSFFVVAQVALSLVLLVAAGLFIRSLRNAQQIDVGFEAERQLLMSFDLGLQNYNRERGRAFKQQLEQRVSNLPGVQSVALANIVPLGAASDQDRGIYIDGYTPPSGLKTIPINFNIVSAGYFETMGIRLLRGRNFNAQDHDKAPTVAILNEAAARRFWPGQDAVGKRIRYGNNEEVEIIGLVRDLKYVTLGEDPRPYLYSPASQIYSSSQVLHVRTSGDPAQFTGAVQNEVHALDPNLPLYQIKTMRQHLQSALLIPQFAATMLSGFALLALLLASIGLYGVTAYAVSQRTREIGVRLALGAKTSDVLLLIVRQGLKLVLIGLVPGLLAAILLTRALTSFLYGVNANDPLTFGVIVLLLTLVAFFACLIPARRAMKVEPMTALRYE